MGIIGTKSYKKIDTLPENRLTTGGCYDNLIYCLHFAFRMGPFPKWESAPADFLVTFYNMRRVIAIAMFSRRLLAKAT